MTATVQTSTSNFTMRSSVYRVGQSAMVESRQTFFAIDGEGVNRADGSQDYVLLCGSDGRYIEDWENGLSSIQCFEFLLNAKNRRRVMVAFGLSYDANMFLRDLPRRTLERLWQNGFAHWNDYRIEFVPRKHFRVSRRVNGVTQESATVWDVWGFFQLSFVRALRDWNVSEAKEIEAYKQKRNEFQPSDAAHIREYCIAECKNLVELMTRLKAALDALGIKLPGWYGAGAIAGALLKQHKIKRAIPELDTALDMLATSAYFGGRVENFVVGHLPGVYDYDINSAYPAAMVTLPNLRRGRWERTKEPGTFGVYYVRWNVDGERLTPFPLRFKGNVYWPSSGEGWYHAPEVAVAQKLYGGEGIQILDGWRFVPESMDYPFTWIKGLYAARQEFKRAGDAREKPLKLGANSLYGKMAQQVSHRDTVPPYQCLMYAGYVTAHCRAKVLHAASQNPDAIVAIATDGLYSREPLNLPVSDKLGGWSESRVDEAVLVVQSGVMLSASARYAKTRGVSTGQLSYEALLEVWKRDGIDGALQFEETRFIGLGYALQSRDFEGNWRRWKRIPKSITFAPEPRKFRAHEITLLEVYGEHGGQYEYWKLNPCSGDGMKSEPYRREKDAEFLLDLEQPMDTEFE